MTAAPMKDGLVDLHLAGRELRIEFAWVGEQTPGAPLIVQTTKLK